MADLASRITKPADAPAADAAQAEAPVDGGNSGLVESTYDVEVKLSELQSDTENPLSSVTSFDELGLPKPINDGLLAMNFKKPSKIQEKALPLMLSNPPRNMIAQSQSGTGKTAAFVLTVLSRVDYSKPTQPQALLLAPSRELARQIQSVIQMIGQFCENLTVVAAIPGAVPRDTGVQGNVVVGTPGTVMDLVRRRQFDVSQLKVLVIDEADNMLDQQGMGDQCIRVKGYGSRDTSRLRIIRTANTRGRMLPKNIQILLFSATFPDKVMKYAERFAPNANQIKLRHQELTVKGISQMYMDCPDERAKYEILCKLYGLMTIGSSVIFVKVRSRRRGVGGAQVLTLGCRLERAPTRSSGGWRQMGTRSRCCTVRTRARTAMLCLMISGQGAPKCSSPPTCWRAVSTCRVSQW